MQLQLHVLLRESAAVYINFGGDNRPLPFHLGAARRHVQLLLLVLLHILRHVHGVAVHAVAAQGVAFRMCTYKHRHKGQGDRWGIGGGGFKHMTHSKVTRVFHDGPPAQYRNKQGEQLAAAAAAAAVAEGSSLEGCFDQQMRPYFKLIARARQQGDLFCVAGNAVVYFHQEPASATPHLDEVFAAGGNDWVAVDVLRVDAAPERRRLLLYAVIVEGMHGRHHAGVEGIQGADVRFARFGDKRHAVGRDVSCVVGSSSAPDGLDNLRQAAIKSAKFLRATPVHRHGRESRWQRNRLFVFEYIGRGASLNGGSSFIREGDEACSNRQGRGLLPFGDIGGGGGKRTSWPHLFDGGGCDGLGLFRRHHCQKSSTRCVAVGTCRLFICVRHICVHAVAGVRLCATCLCCFRRALAPLPVAGVGGMGCISATTAAVSTAFRGGYCLIFRFM